MHLLCRRENTYKCYLPFYKDAEQVEKIPEICGKVEADRARKSPIAMAATAPLRSGWQSWLRAVKQDYQRR
jgi:hypothetical protein